MGYWEEGIGKGVLRRVIVKGQIGRGLLGRRYWEGKIEKGALRRER